MKLYAIRRPMGWKTPDDLAEAAKVSARVGDEEMSSDIRWIRSYVVIEADGSLGTICIYEASGPEKIREHAERAGLLAEGFGAGDRHQKSGPAAAASASGGPSPTGCSIGASWPVWSANFG